MNNSHALKCNKCLWILLEVILSANGSPEMRHNESNSGLTYQMMLKHKTRHRQTVRRVCVIRSAFDPIFAPAFCSKKGISEPFCLLTVKTVCVSTVWANIGASAASLANVICFKTNCFFTLALDVCSGGSSFVSPFSHFAMDYYYYSFIFITFSRYILNVYFVILPDYYR